MNAQMPAQSLLLAIAAIAMRAQKVAVTMIVAGSVPTALTMEAEAMLEALEMMKDDSDVDDPLLSSMA